MIRQQRAVLVFVVLLGVLTLGAAPTAADPGPTGASPRVVGPARIEGDVTVELLTVVSDHPTNPPGRIIYRTYRFIPQCSTGGCRTVLYRPRGDDFTRFVLVPGRLTSGERVYRGTARPLADCGSPDGQITVPDAYTSVERIVVHPRRVNADNTATKVRGEFRVQATLTPAGVAGGCEQGTPTVYSFRSVTPFTT